MFTYLNFENFLNQAKGVIQWLEWKLQK